MEAEPGYGAHLAAYLTTARGLGLPRGNSGQDHARPTRRGGDWLGRKLVTGNGSAFARRIDAAIAKATSTPTRSRLRRRRRARST
jgi:hypothetical protein